MRSRVESLFVLAGFALIVFGFYLWSPALAVIVGGLLLILLGFGLRWARDQDARTVTTHE